MGVILTVIGIIWWMLLGAAIAMGIFAWRGKRMYSDSDPIWHYRCWLGRRCEVKKDGGWHRCVVVAVSWKGGVNVRKLEGGKAWWVQKDKVEELVRWW